MEGQGASGTASEQTGRRRGCTSSVPDPSLPSMTPVFAKQGLPLVPELKQLVLRAAHAAAALSISQTTGEFGRLNAFVPSFPTACSTIFWTQDPIIPKPSAACGASEGLHCGAPAQEWVTLSFSKLTAKERIVPSDMTATEVEESQRFPHAPGCGSAEK